MGDDKRKYIRFECVVPVDLVNIPGGEGENQEARIDNVSREGLGMVLDLGIDLNPGSDVRFQIRNPERRKVSNVIGEVVWSRPKEGRVEVGLKIKRIENATKSELLDLGFNQWRATKSKKTKKS